MNVIKKLFFILPLVFCLPVYAGALVNYLDVNQGMVVFSTDESKSTTSPACVEPANTTSWALSLTSENGRAIYSMLMTAMASNLSISVESASDCQDFSGYERPLRVWFDGAQVDKTTPTQSEVETVKVFKTVAYGARKAGGSSDYCSIYATLKNKDNQSYMWSDSDNYGNTYCSCREGSRLVTVSYDNVSYRSYLQCVIEVNTPVIP